MAKVQVIQAKTANQNSLRVAAYCRVSSDSDAQLHSYEAQIEYFTEIAAKHPNWELVDVYADEGISGTATNRRDDLKRMIEDCRQGKIDKVIVKSVSRLARNTSDCLKIIRDLKQLGVSVRCEKEKFDTQTMTGEMLITLWANMAQEESVSISKNMRWSYKKRMESGEFITCTAPFGYRLADGKNLEIHEKEAAVVRHIFHLYLNGKGVSAIAQKLNQSKIEKGNHQKWSESSLLYMLSNEKYIGDSLTQKSAMTDDFPYVRKPNIGQKEQYYTRNSHCAIIEKEEFQRVQELLKERRPYGYIGYKTYVLTKRIYCSRCNVAYKRRQSKSGHISWTCAKHDKNAQHCSAKPIAEQRIYEVFETVTAKLKAHKEIIIVPAIEQLEQLRVQVRQQSGGLELKAQLAKVEQQDHRIAQLHRNNILDDGAYIEKHNQLQAKKTEIRRKLRLLTDSCGIAGKIQGLEKLMLQLENAKELPWEILQRITAHPDGKLIFTLTGGIELCEE